MFAALRAAIVSLIDATAFEHGLVIEAAEFKATFVRYPEKGFPEHGSDVEPLIDLQRRTISASYRSFLGDESVEGFINGGAILVFDKPSPRDCG
jgi:hypothetical protein